MEEFEVYNDLINIPVVPLRGLVVFPDMTLHFDVGRKKSVAALKSAMNGNQKVFLVAQRDAAVDDPNIDDLYSFGVICTLRQLIRVPNSENLRAVVNGQDRGRLISFNQTKPFVMATVEVIERAVSEDTREEKAYIRAVKKEFERYAAIMSKISNEVKAGVISMNDGGKLCDFICSNSFIDYEEKQGILESLDVMDRLANLFVLLKKENAILEIEAELQDKVQSEIDKNQREYYLREELKVISETLGHSTISITADTYLTVMTKAQQPANVMSSLFGAQ